MSEDVLLIEKSEGIALVTLNRPDKLNALSRDLRRALKSTFEELRTDEDVDVVILTGSGRAFCAGLDLRELGGESGGDEAERSDAVAGADVVAAACSAPM